MRAINSDTKAVEVTLSGKNFGRTTYSLSAMIGTYGCSATDSRHWASTSKLHDKLVSETQCVLEHEIDARSNEKPFVDVSTVLF